MTTTRELAEWDWVVFPNYGKLHRLAFVRLDDDEDQPFVPVESAGSDGEDVWCGETAGYGITSCGRRGLLLIPGIGTRMGAERCKRCCIRTGYPQGKGSPKNDDACRPLVTERLGQLL